jgi:hypothetical protein
MILGFLASPFVVGSALQLAGSVKLGANVGHPLAEFRVQPVGLGHLDTLAGADNRLLDRELPGEGTEGLEGALLTVGKGQPEWLLLLGWGFALGEGQR